MKSLNKKANCLSFLSHILTLELSFIANWLSKYLKIYKKYDI